MTIMRSLINLLLETTINPLSMAAIESTAKNFGIELDIWENDERIDLHWIARKGAKKGSGAIIIQMICDYADQTAKFILLQVENDELGVYYSAWGFDDIDDDELEDNFPDWDDILIRYPQRA